tara:strand:- start:1235 stop:2305 length:1071 start_codon:yes stop_codon:yes gene_type:complete
MKKGQITIFIILALFFVIAIVIIILFNSNINEEIPPMATPIKSYIDSCLELTSDKAVKYIIFQGGYYNPMDSKEYLSLKVPYYFRLGQETIPNKKQFEEEISKYIEKELPKCLNFTGFEKEGYKISSKSPKIQTDLEEVVEIHLDYLVSIKKEDNVVEFKDFEYVEYFNFNRLYDILNSFVQEHQKNPDFAPIGFLSLLAHENDFKFDMVYLSDDEIIYSFIFEDIYKEPLVFNFISKYKWDVQKSQSPIKIKPIPRLTVFEGDDFYYNVDLEKGINVKFTDYTDLFDIDEKSGEIDFSVEGVDAGSYEIIIKAYDSKGNEDIQLLVIDVRKRIIFDYFDVNYDELNNESEENGSI